MVHINTETGQVIRITDAIVSYTDIYIPESIRNFIFMTYLNEIIEDVKKDNGFVFKVKEKLDENTLYKICPGITKTKKKNVYVFPVSKLYLVVIDDYTFAITSIPEEFLNKKNQIQVTVKKEVRQEKPENQKQEKNEKHFKQTTENKKTQKDGAKK